MTTDYSDWEYRVRERDKCPEYFKPVNGGATCRCTREKGHEGSHICQIMKGKILAKSRDLEVRLE